MQQRFKPSNVSRFCQLGNFFKRPNLRDKIFHWLICKNTNKINRLILSPQTRQLRDNSRPWCHRITHSVS